MCLPAVYGLAAGHLTRIVGQLLDKRLVYLLGAGQRRQQQRRPTACTSRQAPAGHSNNRGAAVTGATHIARLNGALGSKATGPSTGL